MNINKAVQNKDDPEARAYIRAYNHSAVEREIPYVIDLEDHEKIIRALEERMHNCVPSLMWDDLDELHEMIDYVNHILNLPEDQQCEQMINRLHGHLAAGESIDEELQGFVYDLFRKLCNDHNIQYADLDADNIIDAYEYILPKIKQHNGVDTMTNIENMTEREFLEFLTQLEEEIDKKCGPLDWIDPTAYYSERTVLWAWSNTNLDQDDAAFFVQCRKIHDLIVNKDDMYRAEMICYETEEIEHTDGSISTLEAEVTIRARFDGGELHKDQ